MQDQIACLKPYEECKESKILDKIAKYLRKKYPYGVKLAKEEGILSEVTGAVRSIIKLTLILLILI